MARLKRHGPVPLYLQLQDSIRADIVSRRLRPHQQLPSERDLSARFRVSRMTVREALTELARAGWIYSRVGKGTFVGEPKIDQQLKTLTGFSQEMQARGSTPASKVLEATVRTAGNRIGTALRIAPESEIVLLSRLRLSDGLPLAIEVVHLPHRYCPNLLRHDFAVESLYAVLEREYGLRLTRAEQTIEAALAGPREATLLRLTPPAPVLIMERSTFTAHEVLIEYVHSIYRGDRFKFRSDLAPRPLLTAASEFPE